MKQFLKPLILISSVLAIYGCSKVTVSENNIFNPLPASSAAITSVGFLNGNPDTTAFPTTAVPSATPLVVSDVKIILENSPPLAYNVTVSISANPGLLTSGFTPLPAGAMTFPSTVVIPAGSVSGTLPVTLNNTSSLSLSTVYGYGFTITVASNGVGISTDKKNVLVQLKIKNAYEGIYKVVSGNVTRYQNPTTIENSSPLSGLLGGNPDVILQTIDAYRLSIPDPLHTGSLYWAFPTNVQVAGIDGVTLTVNPVNNQVTAISTLNITLGNWAGHPNYYDPATKTFYLAWRWNPTANVREYEIVLKYDGPL